MEISKYAHQPHEDSKILVVGQKYLGVPRGAVKKPKSFPAAAADRGLDIPTNTLLDHALDIV